MAAAAPTTPASVSTASRVDGRPSHAFYGELRWSEEHGAHLLLSTGLVGGEDLMLEISPRTTVWSYRGLQCALLRVQLLLLCARTPAERDQWVRSVASLQSSLPVSVVAPQIGIGWAASSVPPPSLETPPCRPDMPPGDDLPAELPPEGEEV
eukprot:NODE_17492_length_939_cov_13.487685.p2 GENE.NODE_17492_length_939_cov_13.487685~~NODE_17492_length_939_cov_13.487685.p2  ORF type:complete len:152 (-),score=39.67 NODE_17492_length_939_cov_13.487685:310-765(-)